jgi:hypothetical protein
MRNAVKQKDCEACLAEKSELYVEFEVIAVTYEVFEKVESFSKATNASRKQSHFFRSPHF